MLLVTYQRLPDLLGYEWHHGVHETEEMLEHPGQGRANRGPLRLGLRFASVWQSWTSS